MTFHLMEQLAFGLHCLKNQTHRCGLRITEIIADATPGEKIVLPLEEVLEFLHWLELSDPVHTIEAVIFLHALGVNLFADFSEVQLTQDQRHTLREHVYPVVRILMLNRRIDGIQALVFLYGLHVNLFDQFDRSALTLDDHEMIKQEVEPLVQWVRARHLSGRRIVAYLATLGIECENFLAGDPPREVAIRWGNPQDRRRLTTTTS